MTYNKEEVGSRDGGQWVLRWNSQKWLMLWYYTKNQYS